MGLLGVMFLIKYLLERGYRWFRNLGKRSYIKKRRYNDSNDDYIGYTAKDFFSPSEYDCFGILENVLEKEYLGRYKVFPKVRLWDIIDVDKETTNTLLAENKIARKHIDFVVVDSENRYDPVLAIELNWSSHNNYKARRTDDFKYNVLKEAGIELAFLKNWVSMTVVWEVIEESLKNNNINL